MSSSGKIYYRLFVKLERIVSSFVYEFNAEARRSARRLAHKHRGAEKNTEIDTEICSSVSKLGARLCVLRAFGFQSLRLF